MSEPWVTLTRRYGSMEGSPTPEQLAEAIAELYHEDHPDMKEADYEEHGVASLAYASGDEGPMFTLEISRRQTILFEQWADTDYESELAPAGELLNISEAHARELWTWLAQGQLALVQAQPWQKVPAKE